MANRASLASVFPDLTRSPIRLPLPEARVFRPRERIFYASVIHGNFPFLCITGAESQSSMVHVLTNTVAAPRHGRNSPVSASTPRAPSNSRPVAVRAKKHCAAQAEYGRLAAQA